ncbi:hypothetical protein GALL_463100 [mine drainage metagenome]|uniref:Uncharacterized protein n=1 Tax=mine drainage metagenome TaxID=410659 RepID=A0A1J5Q7Z8_9ZZZZ
MPTPLWVRGIGRERLAGVLDAVASLVGVDVVGLAVGEPRQALVRILRRELARGAADRVAVRFASTLEALEIQCADAAAAAPVRRRASVRPAALFDKRTPARAATESPPNLRARNGCLLLKKYFKYMINPP